MDCRLVIKNFRKNDFGPALLNFGLVVGGWGIGESEGVTIGPFVESSVGWWTSSERHDVDGTVFVNSVKGASVLFGASSFFPALFSPKNSLLSVLTLPEQMSRGPPRLLPALPRRHFDLARRHGRRRLLRGFFEARAVRRTRRGVQCRLLGRIRHKRHAGHAAAVGGGANPFGKGRDPVEESRRKNLAGGYLKTEECDRMDARTGHGENREAHFGVLARGGGDEERVVVLITRTWQLLGMIAASWNESVCS